MTRRPVSPVASPANPTDPTGRREAGAGAHLLRAIRLVIVLLFAIGTIAGPVLGGGVFWAAAPR